MKQESEMDRKAETDAEVAWLHTIARAFRAVQRDAEQLAQGADKWPPDGMLANLAQWDAALDRDVSAPLAAELTRITDVLLVLGWLQGMVEVWRGCDFNLLSGNERREAKSLRKMLFVLARGGTAWHIVTHHREGS